MQKFADKYAPEKFDDLVLSDADAGHYLRGFADNRRHDSVILHGPYGTGKSVAARIIAAARSVDETPATVDFVRACDVDDSRLKAIQNRWTFRQYNGDPMPVNIIDEIDQVPEKLQKKLRWLLDQQPARGCFVFTTNFYEKLDGGLRDRCHEEQLPRPDSEQWLSRARWILDQEDIEIEDEDLEELLASCSSIREIMRALDGLVVEVAEAA